MLALFQYIDEALSSCVCVGSSSYIKYRKYRYFAERYSNNCLWLRCAQNQPKNRELRIYPRNV